MEKKMTKKEMFNLIKTELAENAEIVAFCEYQIELLERKKSNSNSKANEKMANEVELTYEAMVAVNKAVTPSELISAYDLSALANENGVVSPQKISAMLKKLVESDRVESYKDKKKTYFVLKEEKEE